MSTPVIGLDRDGTINEDIGTYVTKPEDFKPIEGSLEAVKIIRDKGYDVVILTNQAGIMKGIMDAVDVDLVHNYMLELLGNIGCKSINGLYYSTTNLKDDIYAKPNTGMFKRASAEIGVNWKNGLYVGDKISDLHVKDRLFDHGPVPLGKGNADILKVFELLSKNDYQGIIIFQAFRDDEGVEIFKDQLNWFHGNVKL